MTLRERVGSALAHESAFGRRITIGLQALIALDMVAFSLGTVPSIQARWERPLWWFEVGVVSIFSTEYLLRLLSAKRPARFALSFFGIIDLVAILPFYLALETSLRPIRALRLLRVFRTLKVIRYSRAARRLLTALRMAAEEMVVFACASGIVLYLAAVGIYHCERDAQPEVFSSVLDGLWWAIATLTTVGYGDAYPVTACGRIFTGLILVLGLGVVAVPTGLFAAALATARKSDEDADE